MENPNYAGYVESDPSGRYGRFEEILGRGAMKTVYRAFDEVLGREVAWNRVSLNDLFGSPEDIQRLYTEVHLLKNLSHDSIIRFDTSWIDNDRRTFNFITEMFSSGTLRNYRQKYKRVNMQAIKNWARQILQGLVYLHSLDPPVIHRDLKCDNIFVNGHLGQVKIGDLGLAAILHGTQHAHSVIGTPEFMAPELYEEEYNELVDVYSFGMCVLEMLSSEYPYSECSNTAQIYKKVISGKKPDAFYRIEDIDAQQFVGKCLEVADKRLPAHLLLLDPFLATDEPPTPNSASPLRIYPPHGDPTEYPILLDEPIRSTNMTITGKLDPEANIIFLQAQLVDPEDEVRNVYFSFDVVHDTTMSVAIEMVNELDITDWEPFEIAAMIENELSSILPSWKNHHLSSSSIHRHEFIYDKHDDEEEEEEGKDNETEDKNNDNKYPSYQDISFNNDDTSSQSSYNSFNSSNIIYSAVDDGGSRGSFATPRSLGSTRFCSMDDTEQKRATSAAARRTRRAKATVEAKVNKFRSFMDVRSQLLHKALRQAMQKKRSSTTVGAVEGIGFESLEISGKHNLARRAGS